MNLQKLLEEAHANQDKILEAASSQDPTLLKDTISE